MTDEPRDGAVQRITLKGMLMGERPLPGGGRREILTIVEEQRPHGPAEGSMVSVITAERRRVARYVAWINYYELDEISRQEPGVWRLVEPEVPYEAVVEWHPFARPDEVPPSRTPDEDGALVERLARLPASLQAALEQRNGQAPAPPADGGWSAAEIIRHICASDAIQSPRVCAILTQPGCHLPARDERAWAAAMARSGLPLEHHVAALRLRRQELTALLATLDAAEWSLVGEHPALGPLSIRDVCQALGEHEDEHLAQLRALTPAPSVS